MDVRSSSAHRNWLLVTAIVVGSFGPVFSLGTHAATDEAARWSLDLLAWPLDGAEQYVDGTMRFLTALTGGFLFGWGVMILALRQWVFDAAPDQVRRAVLAGLVAWCVLDSAGSLVAGVASNVGFNLLVLVTAAGPLWFRAQRP